MFTTLITQPITNILVLIYQILYAAHVPYALGFAIIVLTAIIRVALFPVIAQQLRASKKMQEIQPHINKLKEKHKGDAQRLQQETMKLYREFGINPIAGCLPLLIQLPIIWGLYGVLQNTVKATSIESVNQMVYFGSLKLTTMWDTTFFGLHLDKSIADHMKVIGPVVLLIPVLTGVLQFIQSKQMFPAKPAAQTTTKKDTASDMAQAFQMQTMYMFPVMIAFFSYSLPVGLSLYWNTFTLFGILQQWLITRSTKRAAQTGAVVKKGR